MSVFLCSNSPYRFWNAVVPTPKKVVDFWPCCGQSGCDCIACQRSDLDGLGNLIYKYDVYINIYIYICICNMI